jgi:hypothetical protein
MKNFAVALSNRCFELYLRSRAWLNRRRHPELAKQYRGASQSERFQIAQNMLVRDRILARLKGVKSSSPRYPDVWDYHVPPGRHGEIVARIRRAAARSDMQRIRDRSHARY